jgi:hypothetical protein
MESRSTNHLVLETPAECITQSQMQQFLSLGDQLGWHTEVLGKAPMLKEPVRLQDWLLVPAHEDATELPHRTLKRIQTIYTQGLRPQGFVVVHEAPMQLTAPKPETQEKPAFEWEGGGKVFIAIAKVMGALLLGGMLLPLGLLAGLIMLDPILVAVTQDGYWIEIDRWQV